MDSKTDQPLTEQPQIEDLKPRTRSLRMILGCFLFVVLLLVYLFQNNLKIYLKESGDHLWSTKEEPPANVVSTRTQPIASTFFWDRIQLANNRSNSKKNLKRIAKAMYDYHREQYQFPPGGMSINSNNTYHSWQTFILPFLNQTEMYERIDFDEPWNNYRNHELFQQQVPDYLNPSITEKVAPDGSALTHYAGNSLLLKSDFPIRLSSICDELQHTIMAVERGNDFPAWGDPASLADPQKVIGPDQISSYPDGNHALMCDGSVRLISKDIDRSILKALSTPNSGEEIGEY